jgi:hypothetical protein
MHASAIICLSQNFENSHCCRVQAEITPVSFTLLWTVFQTPDDIFSIRTLASYRIFQLGVSCNYRSQILLLHIILKFWMTEGVILSSVIQEAFKL